METSEGLPWPSNVFGVSYSPRKVPHGNSYRQRSYSDHRHMLFADSSAFQDTTSQVWKGLIRPGKAMEELTSPAHFIPSILPGASTFHGGKFSPHLCPGGMLTLPPLL